MLSLREHAELLTPRPANSSQQPTTCRSLARRFRASVCATLRVALPESEGTWRLSEKNVGPTIAHIFCSRHLERFVWLVAAALLPSASYALFVGQISLS